MVGLQDMLESEASDSDGGAQLEHGAEFKVNEDFARKFTYNKKREEIRRLEEKVGSSAGKRKRGGEDAQTSDDSSSSTSEEEDDDAELATEHLDAEIFATLNAIRSKDPRVYDPTVTFYTPLELEPGVKTTETKKEKPMYLRDYHREQLLKNTVSDDAEADPLSYSQEQEALKRSIVGEIHAAAQESDKDSDDDQDGTFLVAKEKVEPSHRAAETILDVEKADDDPEGYIAKFMSARAWIPTSHSQPQPFESDDSEEERRAEEFEEAYNFRFEDPEKSNERLRTHARDLAAKYSVRREELNPRKKKREAEKQKKRLLREQIREEKARLRKLKIEETEEKVAKIKRAAGLKSTEIELEDWQKFVNEEWDDARWEAEMQRRFGDQYYAEADAMSGNDDEEVHLVKTKVRKPRWDDDIDIGDIIPGFVEREAITYNLTDEEADDEMPNETNKRSKDHRKELLRNSKDAKKERKIIEQLVDDRLELDVALSNGPAKASRFRYRNTSPTSFGLSAHDILMADDSQLNQYAGLKKLAAFRDPAKKHKDQKHLGKKARLRKWRAETFGSEDGPQSSNLNRDTEEQDPINPEVGDKRMKRRRPKKIKKGITA